MTQVRIPFITVTDFEKASISLVIHPRAGTSERVSALSNSTADLIKRAAALTREIRSSTTMSQGQKAAAIKKAHANFDAKGTAAITQVRAAVEQEKQETAATIAAHFGRSMSDEMAFLLVQSLRGQQDAWGIVRSDHRYLAALERVPAAVAGLTPEQVGEWREFAVLSVPELADMCKRDEMSTQTLEQVESLGCACAAWMHSQIDEQGLAEFERLSSGEV